MLKENQEIIKLLKEEKYEQAISMCNSYMKKRTHKNELYFYIALAKLFKKQYDEALESVNKAIEIKKEAHYYSNKALILINADRNEEALKSANEALQINGNFSEALHNKSLALVRLEKYEEAIEFGNKAIKLNPNLQQAYTNVGVALSKIGFLEKAIEYYEKGLLLNPEDLHIINNMGVVYIKLNKFGEAIEFFKKALKINNMAEDVYINIALLMLKLNKYDKALEIVKKAIKINNKNSVSWNNAANIEYKLNNFVNSLYNYEICKKFNENYHEVDGNILHIKMHICDWEGIHIIENEIIKNIKKGKKIASPFSILSNIESAEVLKLNSYIHAPLNIKKNYQKERKNKINIAYFSSDFKRHPVTYLVLDLIRKHDRTKFNIFAYSNNNGYEDDYTEKVKKSVDEWVDIKYLSDAEVIQNTSMNQIDVIIDLNGWTEGFRSLLHNTKLAPIQINMLGYPGTMGNKNYDYIVADENLIPLSHEKYYSEKIIRLKCYQPRSKIDENIIIKKQIKDGVVYGCYNNLYKITPAIFDAWITIINKVEKSKLILYVNNEKARENINNKILKYKINNEKIEFKVRKNYEKYLESYNEIDLFLDTYPFGAGATAGDALYMNTPILTIEGDSFTSRMSSSLLKTLKIQELICKDIDEYIIKAIKLGTNKTLLNDMKNLVNINKKYIFQNNYSQEFDMILKDICSELM